jgi:hypothetical protein
VSGFSPTEVARLLAEAENGATADERGKRYETLLRYVFDSVPESLVVANERNYFGAEQVDLAVSNGGGFPGLPGQFLVDAANGLSGDAAESSYAHSLASAASAQGCRLVVITTADLLSLCSADDLVLMLRTRWLAAWANGGIGVG